MKTGPHVTLQISLAPSDWRHAQVVLPHQLRLWGAQVDEVLLTVDERRSPGRFGGATAWEEACRRLADLTAGLAGARVETVRYDPASARAVAAGFCGGAPVPAKDWRGGPYYSYLYALHAASHDWVFHLDSDLLFGGGSTHWVEEALEAAQADPRLVFLSPLPGPPRADHRLAQPGAVPVAVAGHAGFRFAEMSTRLFLCDRRRLATVLGPVSRRRPGARARVLALLDGTPAWELPEVVLSAAMRRAGAWRFDFEGSAPGCWSLHPPYRTDAFYEGLPQLVRRIEAGDVPDAQRGDPDVNDSMVDWGPARARLRQQRWWRRLWRRLRA